MGRSESPRRDAGGRGRPAWPVYQAGPQPRRSNDRTSRTGGHTRDAAHQFRLLSTKARCLIHGIIARSFAPTSSIGCAAFFARIALNEVWLTRFSSIQSLTNLPDWMSPRILFISALVSGVTTRGPETYCPYSAVFDTE